MTSKTPQNEAPNSTFVYVTFIRTTPERLWSALTTPAEMRDYWFGMQLDSDWKPGSAWQMTFPDGRINSVGTVLECEPPKRLVLSWRSEYNPEFNAEGIARCSMELEPLAGAVKLTITHSIDRPHSKLIEAVSGGWPRILSNLKSLLETGQVILPPPTHQPQPAATEAEAVRA